MKSTNPVAGQPTPAIDACLAEATAGLAAGRTGREPAVGRRGPDRLVAASPASLAAGQRLLAGRAQRAAVHVLHVVPGPAWPSVRGWATAAQAKASAAKSSTATATAAGTSTKSTTGTSTGGEWAFLDDKHVSIEDKLFKFMTLVQKKNDKELEDKIKDFKANYTKAGSGTSSSSASKSSGGGLFGFVKQALGAAAPRWRRPSRRPLPRSSRRSSTRAAAPARPPRARPRRPARPTRRSRCWRSSGSWRSRTRCSPASPTS
jgi:hypothetical protein